MADVLMSGSELLDALEMAGATFTIVHGDLRVTVASRALTPAMRAGLADKGPLLAAYLARQWQRHLDSLPLRTDDPRPDLTEDSAQWTQLLNLAHGAATVELREALHCLRCCGARLAWRGSALYLTRGDETDDAEYGDWRQRWLMPHATVLAEVLTRLASLVRPAAA